MFVCTPTSYLSCSHLSLFNFIFHFNWIPVPFLQVTSFSKLVISTSFRFPVSHFLVPIFRFPLVFLWQYFFCSLALSCIFCFYFLVSHIFSFPPFFVYVFCTAWWNITSSHRCVHRCTYHGTNRNPNSYRTLDFTRNPGRMLHVSARDRRHSLRDNYYKLRVRIILRYDHR